MIRMIMLTTFAIPASKAYVKKSLRIRCEQILLPAYRKLAHGA